VGCLPANELLIVVRCRADASCLSITLSLNKDHSYLNRGERLGDVDLAIEVSSRIENSNQRPEAHLRYARESGRQFGDFTEELYWAEAAIYQVLKARRRTISIQPWHSFIGMKKRADFQYKVLSGDVDKIANELALNERDATQQAFL